MMLGQVLVGMEELPHGRAAPFLQYFHLAANEESTGNFKGKPNEASALLQNSISMYSHLKPHLLLNHLFTSTLGCFLNLKLFGYS